MCDVHIGQKIKFVLPIPLTSLKQTLWGKVVYINRKHRFYTVEFKFSDGRKYLESFRFGDGGNDD